MQNIHIFLPFENKNVKIAEITRGGVYATFLSRDSLKEINLLKNKNNLSDYKLDTLITAGIYFLIGENDELNDILDVYIGKSDDCLKRINEHNDKDEKDFQKIICITSSKNDYNIGHATYLEHHITKIAKELDRCNLTNKIASPNTKVTPEIKADLKLDISSIKTLIEVFNFNILTPKKIGKSLDNSNCLIHKKETEEENEIFYCKSSKGADASGVYNENEGTMLVLKGSKIAKDNTSSWGDNYLKIRKRLINENILSANDETTYIFNKDYEFKSPSTASAIVLARSSNGWTEWKNKERKTLKDIYLV